MKKYTHAWLAFKAIERLEIAAVSDNDKPYAANLIKWFKNHKDGVVSGAWFPDSIIKDNATSHVKKMIPVPGGTVAFRSLPGVMRLYDFGRQFRLYQQSFIIGENDNLPERCEALSHAVIDNLRIQDTEEKGSSISPSDNHIALILFMLSHYVADAHVPFHCDGRKFSDGFNLHGKVEGVWEKDIEKSFEIDYANERFYYNPHSYPLLKNESFFNTSYLKKVEEDMMVRKFVLDWGKDNSNVLDYINSVCQYSYLMSYGFAPEQYNESNVTSDNWRRLNGQVLMFEDLSVAFLSDAIDSISRIWFHVWRRYMKWIENR